MPNGPTTRTAVVVGSTGIIGRAIAAKLAELGGWRVLGVTRSGGTVPGVDEAIAVDLSDPEEARRRLAAAAGATHMFFAAYLPMGTGPLRSRRTERCWSTRSRGWRPSGRPCDTSR
jgi:NAD(P)-dependent dehydrogenase (short-subunit alcohol dehydrogenase family)